MDSSGEMVHVLKALELLLLRKLHYENVSVLVKFSQKTSVFYLNYHKFSIKSYVLDVRRF